MREIHCDGGCLCGAVRFRIDGAVLGAAACHCRDCQYVSGGAPAYVVVVARSSLKMIKGEPSSYANIAESGARRTRQFCGTCGTPLFAMDDAYPDVLSVKVGGLDDPSLFKPQAEFWLASAPAWHPVGADVPTFPKGPTSR